MDISKLISTVGEMRPYTQIFLGAGCGIFASLATLKIGKIAALITGSSILMLEVAHIEGYVKVNWHAISKLYERGKQELPVNKTIPNQAKEFATRNKKFTIAFIGGVFIGIGLS